MAVEAVVATALCPMWDLEIDDWMVGPDGATLYEVTSACADHEHSWLLVRNLAMTDAEAAALLDDPDAVEPGEDPRDGFFSYPPDTLVRRVIAPVRR